MIGSSIAMFHEAVELIRWNGTQYGVAQVLNFIECKGYKVEWEPTGSQPAGSGYVPLSQIVGGGWHGGNIQYESLSGYRTMEPGEWLVWSPRFGFFELTDADVARFTDVAEVPTETGYVVTQ